MLACIATPLMAPAHADSSSPLLHAYYDRFAAIVADKVYVWRDDGLPQKLAVENAIQVGTSRLYYFALNKNGDLLRWTSAAARPVTVARNAGHFAPGASGVLVIDRAGTLWLHPANAKRPQRIARGITSATIGDGANYYIDSMGGLFVKGLAHRGQYGDGRLEPTGTFVRTADEAWQVRAHTGHAILLKRNGDVYGTGGNIYGPVGKHGLGDKAVRWSKILSGMKAVATGASHSLAIGKDNTLYAWGSDYGVEPKRLLHGIRAVAAGSQMTIALASDGVLWRWTDARTPRKVPLP